MVRAMADADTAVEFIPADLAPGDGKALELDCRDLDVVRVHAVHHMPLCTCRTRWSRRRGDERDWLDGCEPGRCKLPGLASLRRDFQRRLRSRWWRRWSIPIRTSRIAWSAW